MAPRNRHSVSVRDLTGIHKVILKQRYGVSEGRDSRPTALTINTAETEGRKQRKGEAGKGQ
eukprot:5799732-Heterocapsa_arctica.AAC.1